MRIRAPIVALSLLLGGWGLCGFACTQAQLTAGVTAACAVGQITAATAGLNATALGKPKVAAQIAAAQGLASTDCPAALAAISAAYAAAAVN